MWSGCQTPRHVFFYFYPFLAPVGVPKFAWLWKTNAMISSYCIYSYLIDHIKPYIHIYICTIYLQSTVYVIYCYMIIQKHHPTSSNMYPSNIRFHNSFHSSIPGFFETTAVLHTGAAAGSAPTTSPDTATAAALIGGAGQCSTAWDAEENALIHFARVLTGCAKKVKLDSSRFYVLVTVRNVDEDLMMRRLDSKSLWTCPSRSFSWSQLKILEFLWFAVCHVWRVLKQDMLEIERVGYWWYWVLDLALFQRQHRLHGPFVTFPCFHVSGAFLWQLRGTMLSWGLRGVKIVWETEGTSRLV